MEPTTTIPRVMAPPPRVPGLPLLGHLLPLTHDVIGFLLEQQRRFGPVFRLRVMHQDLVVLAGLEANEFVQEEGAHCFSSRETWEPMLAEMNAPNALVGLDGDSLATLRRTLAPEFSFEAARDHTQRFAALALDAMRTRPTASLIPGVDFGQRLASQQIGGALVGVHPNPEEHDAILRYTNAIVVNLALRRLPAWTLRLRGLQFQRDRQRAFSFADRLVREHLAREGRDGDYIDVVTELAKIHPRLFAQDELRAAALLPFFTGVDTVGQTLACLLYAVLRDPALHQRLCAEADTLFVDGTLDTAALEGARDLEGAVLEALRLYPVAFGMPRTAVDTFYFEDHRIDKWQSLLVFSAAPHFDAACFPDPLRFDIERHRAPRNESLRAHAFAPFGCGPHRCLGAGFAQVQLVATLATLLHHCRLALPEPAQTFRFLLRPTLSLGSKFAFRFDGWRHAPPAAS